MVRVLNQLHSRTIIGTRIPRSPITNADHIVAARYICFVAESMLNQVTL